MPNEQPIGLCRVRPVELKIEDIAFGGKGVGRTNGKAVFVPFTIEQEQVTARLVREKKQFAEAELEAVLQPSPDRTTPECPYFGRCGGCSYQHMNYGHQLAVKQRQVEQALRRIGGFENPPVRPIVASPKEYGYRNRITVHAEDGLVGYYRRDAHKLIDVDRCPIAAPEVNEALRDLRARNPRDGHYSLRARRGPRVFAQTNDAVAEAIARLVDELIPADQELLIDAYCGSGFFAKRLLHKFKRAVGIEWDRFAVAAAQEGAQPNESYIVGDVERELRVQLSASGPETATVIVDPPAVGLGSAARRTLLEHAPATLIYVSCNPPTLARDLRELRARFVIESVTPLDMFPQTAEIEVAVHLQRI